MIDTPDVNLPAPIERPAPLEPTGRTRKAVDLMIWSGHHRDQAAKLAGMTPKSLYNALRRHHVRAYYLDQIRVLRESSLAKNHHRLEAIADQDDNRMAAVAAIKTMQHIADEQQATPSRVNRAPGVVIIVRSSETQSARGPLIEVRDAGRVPPDRDALPSPASDDGA